VVTRHAAIGTAIEPEMLLDVIALPPSADERNPEIGVEPLGRRGLAGRAA